MLFTVTLFESMSIFSLQKVPFILVVGDKEKANGTVAVRARGNQDLGVMELSAFVSKLSEVIASKS